MTPIYVDRNKTARVMSLVNCDYISLQVAKTAEMLRPHPLNNNILIPYNIAFGGRLPQNIQLFHCDRAVNLPSDKIELSINMWLNAYYVRVEKTPEGDIKVVFFDFLDTFYQSTLTYTFTPYLDMAGVVLSLAKGMVQQQVSSVKDNLVMMAGQYLPAVLGYIVAFNTRARAKTTLGEPEEMQARGNPSDFRTQYLGDVREVVNPRDNPTDITRSPHIRSGHERKLKDGRIVPVRPTIVHPDDYDGQDGPKKVTF